jgi:hypothetical protein
MNVLCGRIITHFCFHYLVVDTASSLSPECRTYQYESFFS